MGEKIISIPLSVWESERKMRFFGADTKEIYGKRFNVFIGISISNKKITSEMASNYLKWGVKNTKNKVAVVIADKLNLVNYEILDKYSKNKSLRRMQKVSNNFENLFLREIKKLPKEDQSKIRIYKWSEIEKSENYEKVRSFLEKEFRKDFEFKSSVLYFIRKYMRKKGRVIEDPKKIDKLASYIIGELPTLLQGIKIDKINYNLCIYPTYFSSGMSQFVMDIHNEELKIGKKLKKIITKKIALVEAWLD